MRARFFLFAGTFVLVVGAFGAQACSSSDEAKSVASSDAGDAAYDVAVADTGPPKEAAAPETDSATGDLSADFSSTIPDASLADGATTTGVCLACAHTQCGDYLKQCNEDCTCQGAVSQLVQCFLQNSGKSKQELAQACGASLLGVNTNVQNLAIGLLGCMNQKCPDECGTAGLKDAGNDADAN